jgi:hypothetical protein
MLKSIILFVSLTRILIGCAPPSQLSQERECKYHIESTKQGIWETKFEVTPNFNYFHFANSKSHLTSKLIIPKFGSQNIIILHITFCKGFFLRRECNRMNLTGTCVGCNNAMLWWVLKESFKASLHGHWKQQALTMKGAPLIFILLTVTLFTLI